MTVLIVGQLIKFYISITVTNNYQNKILEIKLFFCISFDNDAPALAGKGCAGFRTQDTFSVELYLE